jgi:hypothetical protein
MSLVSVAETTMIAAGHDDGSARRSVGVTAEFGCCALIERKHLLS